MNILCVDLIDIGFRIEHRPQALSADACRFTHGRENFKATDILPVKEIGTEQPFDEIGGLFVSACLLHVTNGPVRRSRRRRTLDLFEVKVDPSGQTRLPDPTIDSTGVLGPTEFGFEVGAPVHALGRHPGIEHEGSPADAAVQRRPLVGFQRLLEVPLTNVAPRADRVGEQVEGDREGGCHVPMLSFARG